MASRLSLQLQLALSIFLGLGLGMIFTPSALTNLPRATPTPAMTPVPFKTLPGVWSITVLVRKERAPQILEVNYLEKGRLTSPRSGDSSLEILDQDGVPLYEQSFQPVFTFGEPLTTVSEIRLVFVVPASSKAASLRLYTPQGEARYEIPDSP